MAVRTLPREGTAKIKIKGVLNNSWVLSIVCRLRLQSVYLDRPCQPNKNKPLWALDAHLVRYLESCKVLAAGQQYITICSDKAAVGGFNLQSSLLALPNNLGLVPPPQVMV